MFKNIFIFILSISFCLSCNLTDKDQKIAIVGAGVSGLSAARYLDQKGFTHITVFERNSEPGGKVFTYEYNGRAYDLGAIFFTRVYKKIIRLAEEYNVPAIDFHNLGVVENNGMVTHPFDYMLEKESFSRILADFACINHLLVTYPEISRIGFLNVHESLYQPMSEFLFTINNRVLTVFNPTMVSFGLGFSSETPAIYHIQQYLPLLSLSNILGLMQDSKKEIGVFRGFEDGYQHLWREIAASLDVRYHSEVTQVIRDEQADTIHVTAGGKKDTFDKLIVACPPEKALFFLDATKEEEQLFERIVYDNYVTTLFETRNPLCESNMMLFIENTDKPSAGKVVGFIRPYPDESIYVSYQYSPPDKSDDDLTHAIIDQVDRMGGDVLEIITKKYWETYPHVRTEDFEDGFYEKLDELQGKNNTYFTSLSYGVEATISFTEKIIHDHFLN